MIGPAVLLTVCAAFCAPASANDRVDELTEALAECSDADLSAVLQESFGVFMEETRAYRLAAARRLAEGMHARSRAGWSAMSLALISTRAGDSTRAREVLEAQIQITPEGPDQYELLERLGLAIQGAGDERSALGPLGSAFARGSSNAGVVLGRIALREGRVEQARAIFRTLLTQDPPQSWALRGWGLSMLPSRDDQESMLAIPEHDGPERTDPLSH